MSPEETPSDGRRPPSIFALLASVAGDLPGLLSDRVHLAALEIKRARHALLQMAALAVLAAIFAATAWIGLWILLVVVALNGGVPLWSALVIVLALNAFGVWFVARRALVLAELLTLPATLRRLNFSAPPEKPPAEAPGAAPTVVPGAAS
jgi:uncharacterized membrane protein YqjE